MKYRIIGDTVQTVAIELSEGDAIFGRLGTMLFAKGAIKSETDPKGGSWSGISGSLKVRGEAPLVVYTCENGVGLVGFRSPGPGRIHVVNLDSASRIIARRTSVLVASEGVSVDPVFLDGEDNETVPKQHFVTLGGSGWAFLHGPGNLIDFTLARNEQMVVDGSMILTLDGEISYEPRPTGKLKSKSSAPYVLLMHLSGPGTVVLNTLE